MAKKAELLEQAKKLKLDVNTQNTIAEIEAAIKSAPAAKKGKVTAKPVDKADPDNEEEKLAKSGKRSAKAIAEAEEKVKKEARKEHSDTSPTSGEAEANVKRGPRPVARPLIERRGKKYREAAKLIEADKSYKLTEALELATKTSTSKFDASVEVHARLGVDPRQADQNIRSMVSLPNGTGKTIRVAVFAPSDQHAAAKKAGADIVGDDDLLQKLDKEDIDFDTLITSPQLMPRLGKYARVLGPRGLMPNPKSGTVSTNIAKAVTEAKAGKVEYRVDKQGIVHLGIGKVSFGAAKLQENAKVFFDSLHANKPSSLKDSYVRAITVTTTHGPGIKVDLNQLAS
jgi:large subunit ribosomal protein L1